MSDRTILNPPTHVGIIMDGNGRWATARNKDRSYGHKQGAKTIKDVALSIFDAGVKYLSLYAFSTENFKRPKKEVDELFSILNKGIAEYGESADRIVPLGFAVWSVVIALFLMLYPGRLGKELDIMDSLGARRVSRIVFVLSSSALILLAGSVLGLGAGLLLWDGVTDFLTASIGGGLELGASLSDFITITAAQFAIAILAVFVLAVPLTRTRGLNRRK